MHTAHAPTLPSAKDATASSRSVRRWRALHVLLAVLILGSFVVTTLMCLVLNGSMLWVDESHVPSSDIHLAVATAVNVALTEETSGDDTLVELLSSYESSLSPWRCVAWRATVDCSPHALRQPEGDRSCAEIVANGASGYCEVEDMTSGERFGVMRPQCGSAEKDDSLFRCAYASSFARSRVKLRKEMVVAFKLTNPQPNLKEPGREQLDGISMVADLDRVIDTYATIRALREVLNCSLSIELWFHADDTRNATALTALRAFARRLSDVSLREINRSNTPVGGTNIFAVYNSRFDRVLLLDAAVIMTKDPAILFESSEFHDTGAVFWPNGRNSNILEVNDKLLPSRSKERDVPLGDGIKELSDPVLIDRQRHFKALRKAYEFVLKWPGGLEKLQFVPGNDELFRLAWRKTNSTFHLIQTPPVLMGTLKNESFCPTAIVQHDAQGDTLFLIPIQIQVARDVKFLSNANSVPQLSLKTWTHSPRRHSDAQARLPTVAQTVPWSRLNGNMCFTERDMLRTQEIFVQEVDNRTFFETEETLRRFMLEARDIQQSWKEESEAHALSVKLFPSNETVERSLRCIGWRDTTQCSPNGPREPARDLECHQDVPSGRSGYCEVEDIATGEHFRVMQRTCAKLMPKAVYRCADAPGFANFRSTGNAVVARALKPDFVLEHVSPNESVPRDGIAMVIYPKLVPSAYATIRVLRELLSCELPVELWFRPDEVKRSPGALKPLQELAQNTSMGSISFHEITSSRAVGFATKVFAIYHSNFDRVLFLDADNVPVKDPSYLFDSDEFQDTGAMFWPDFWHPTRSMFGIDANSLVWELLDTPFVDTFEQESGQLLIDRRRHAAPMALTLFYTTPKRNYFNRLRLAYGDKDLFRFAWLKLGTPFHMVQTPPAMAGLRMSTRFCGLTMVQHDINGDVLFLHRNQVKLTGESVINASSSSPSDEFPDPSVWTHLLSFQSGWSRDHYDIQIFRASLPFAANHKCFGRWDLTTSPQFVVQEVAALDFAGFETALRQFAMQAVRIRRENEVGSVIKRLR